jgi:hypothetical protein
MLLLNALLCCLSQVPGPAPVPVPAAAERPTDEREQWFSREQTEACNNAAERGLAWLAAQQTAAGSWTGLVGHKMNSDYVELPAGLPVEAQRRTGAGHLGVTAFCGMAFLAGGHLPDRGRYGDQVRATLDYVIGKGQESGLLSDAGTRMYSHAFATLFLAEIYGMAETGPGKLALERAVNLIVDSQNQQGGWRYNPFDREVDLSVTVCQVQALRAARNIGIRVPVETIERAIDYVRRSRVDRGRYEGLFYYKIHGRGAYDKPNEYAINAAALTALSSAGVHDDNLTDPVLRFLDDDYPSLVDYYSDHFYFWYGNYYAAQAFYQHGGAVCRKFHTRLMADLLKSQLPDGRWRNRVGPGDEWSTAIACILLQMQKQYLPIFQR